MLKTKKHETLENSLNTLIETIGNKPVTIETILKILSGKGRSLILIFLSLPFCQPIQIPGLSTPFGLLIAFLGLRIAFGKNVWLPKFLLSKEISSTTIHKIAKGALKLIKKVRHLIHPRLDWVCNSPIMLIINGLTIFLLGIFLALPLPIPLTNLVSAWGIFLIALGLLEDDGLLVSLGYLTALVTLTFFILLIWGVKNFI